MEETKNRVDYGRVLKELWKRKKLYLYALPIAFVLSCIWILPQPRYYTCDVSLAPEGGSEVSGSNLSSLASSFGFNLGGSGNDAIYPMLYPELFASPEFLVDILSIKVEFDDDDDNHIVTDYYTYLTKYQEDNPLAVPFKKGWKALKEMIVSTDAKDNLAGDVSKLNPFHLSRKDYELVEKMDKIISCSVDKKTDVITLSLTDQNPVVCASLADSVRGRLQNYIINYRTRKAREDVAYYRHLTDSIHVVYKNAMSKYAAYCDANQDAVLQSYLSERDALENDMAMQYQAYSSINTQLMAAQAKLQERTPAFTTLKSASVPAKPAGPKRMIFVAMMLFLTFVGVSIYILRDIIKNAI